MQHQKDIFANLDEFEMTVEAKRQLKSAKAPIDKLRLMIKSRGIEGVLDFGRCFRIMSKDRILTYSEFKRGMRVYSVELDDDQLSKLFKYLDEDNSGKIDFDEFMFRVRVIAFQTTSNNMNFKYKAANE